MLRERYADELELGSQTLEEKLQEELQNAVDDDGDIGNKRLCLHCGLVTTTEDLVEKTTAFRLPDGSIAEAVEMRLCPHCLGDVW